jgi:hypothetical protein
LKIEHNLKKTNAMTMATTDDTRRLVTDLKRLLHRMEVYNPSELSSYSLRGRATMAQEMWAALEQLQEAFPDDGTGAAQLRERVQMACRRAEELAVKKKETEIDWVDEIFFKPTRQAPAEEPVVDESDDDAESAAEESQEERQPVQPRAQEPRRHEDVEALQKEQREQLESEISHMASQLKASTQHMNSTLKSQTDNLQEMEDLATENVDKVGKAADKVQEHNKKAWGSTIATWTLMLTIFGTFLFCMITIRLAPKRANTSLPCLINCQPQEISLQERAVQRMEDLRKKQAEMEKETKKMEQEVAEREEAERLEKEAQQQKEAEVKKAREEEEARRRSEGAIARKLKQAQMRKEQDAALAAAASVVDPEETTPEEKAETTEQKGGDEDDDEDDDEEEDLQAASERLRKQAEAARQAAEQRKFEAEEKVRKQAETASKEEQRKFEAAEKIRQQAEAASKEEEERKLEAEEKIRQQAEAARKVEEERKLQAEKRTQERKASINKRNEAKKRLEEEEQQRVEKERKDAEEKKHEEERVAEEERRAEEQQRMEEEQKAKNAAMASEKSEECSIYDDCIDESEKADVDGDSGEAVCLDGECAATEGPGSGVSGEQMEDFTERDLHKAAVGGDLNALRRYLKVKPELVTHRDENGWELIHEASFGGHIAIVDFLVQLPNVDVNIRTGTNGGNALWWIRNLGGDHPVVKSLKAAGAQSLAPLEPDNPVEADPGFSAIDVLRAAQNGDNKALSRYVDDKPGWINIADSNGWTPLHEAIRNQHAGTVSWIAERGGKLNLRTGKGDGWSPLGMAIDLYGADHAISKLLQRMGAEDLRPEKK